MAISQHYDIVFAIPIHTIKMTGVDFTFNKSINPPIVLASTGLLIALPAGRRLGVWLGLPATKPPNHMLGMTCEPSVGNYLLKLDLLFLFLFLSDFSAKSRSTDFPFPNCYPRSRITGPTLMDFNGEARLRFSSAELPPIFP